MQYVVIVESDGLSAVGPFTSEFAAGRWADNHEEDGIAYHVTPLEKAS
jgi:hypothetical protein